MLSRFSLFTLLIAPAVFAAARNDPFQRYPDLVPNKYIVEFEPKQEQQQSGFAKQLAEGLVGFVEQRTPYLAHPFLHYDHPDIFLGVAIDVVPKGQGARAPSREHVMQQLRGGPNVRKVWPSRWVTLTRPVSSSLGSAIARRSLAQADPVAFGIRATLNATNDALPAHVATGVSIQHERGNFGAGVRACVVDTPIDYSHPALNGGRPAGTPCLGPNCQVEGGYDWLGPTTKGDDFLPSPLTLNGVREHPLDCEHGTHVSGLLAANDEFYPGVAPGAKIRSYAVFGCLDEKKEPTNRQQDAFLLQAILKAGDDGCDLINASLGGGGWPNEPVTAAASRLSRRGTTFVGSAGNSGRGGMNTVASPGDGQDVLTVGASSDGIIPGITLTFSPPLQDGTSDVVAFSETLWTYNSTINNLPLFFFPNATNPDYPAGVCQNITGKQDLTPYLVVIGQGDCSQSDQLENLTAAKVKFALFTLANDRQVDTLHQEESGPQVSGLLADDVKKIYASWKANSKIQVSVNVKDPIHFATVPNPRAEQITFFSSLGPADDGSVKPDFVAPGSKIVSAFPLPILYANIAGTSMSSPIVAGAVALLKAAKGLHTPFDTIRKRLVQTARPTPAVGSTKLQSVFYQGGGIINVTAAIELTTLVEPYRLSVGDSAARKQATNHSFTVTNVGDASQSYTLAQVGAQSVLPLRPSGANGPVDDTETLWLRIPDTDPAEATLTFQPTTFTLEAGKSQVVDYQIQAPADSDRLLSFSGFVQVHSSQPQGSSSIPYAGFSGSFRDIPAAGLAIIGEGKNQTQYPGLYNVSTNELIRTDGTQVDLSATSDNVVGAGYLLATPTEAVYCDIVQANISYTATVPADLSPSTVVGHQQADLKFKDVPVALRLFKSEFQDRTDPGFEFFCIGNANGTNAITGEDALLPDGEYRILLRIHRWTVEDYDLDASYDSYLTHSFVHTANKTSPAA